MKAILFVGHGSRDEQGNEEVRQFVKLLAPNYETMIVETCFLEFGQPSIMEGIDTCVAKGATHVHLIPIILLQAGHSKLHIPATIDEAKEKYAGVGFTYGRPIGVHEQVMEILVDRLTEAGINLDEPQDDATILFIGRGGSDADANSDLCKISRLLWERLKHWNVETAFVGVTHPSVPEGIERCRKLGAKKVIMLPYFLFTGILIERLKKMATDFQQEHPEMEFVLCNYFGYHESLQTVIKDRVEEALTDDVKMNCDTCQYRLMVKEEFAHDHDHDHHHHHHHDHEHDHHHSHDHEKESVK